MENSIQLRGFHTWLMLTTQSHLAYSSAWAVLNVPLYSYVQGNSINQRWQLLAKFPVLLLSGKWHKTPETTPECALGKGHIPSCSQPLPGEASNFWCMHIIHSIISLPIVAIYISVQMAVYIVDTLSALIFCLSYINLWDLFPISFLKIS